MYTIQFSNITISSKINPTYRITNSQQTKQYSLPMHTIHNNTFNIIYKEVYKD